MVASFRGQANALVRKSLVFQKRNSATNCCLLSAPIFFALLLLGIKIAINRVFLAGPEFSCGCQCLACYSVDVDCQQPKRCLPLRRSLQCGCQCLACYSVDTGLPYTGPGTVPGADDGLLTTGFCPSYYGFSCRAFDAKTCGSQYSDPLQSGYCAVVIPSSWPAAMQTPSNASRAGRYSLTPVNQQTPLVLPTSALTLTTAASLSQRLTKPLDMTKVAALANISYTLANGNTVVNGHKLSQIGLQLGTTAASQSNLYLENAFQSGTLFAIVPAATCAALNVTGPVPLAKFIEMAAAAAGLTPSQGANVSNFGVALSSISVTCSETAPQPLTATADLNAELYCGYQQARCGGSLNISDYSAAWDFSDTTVSNFHSSFYVNGTLEAKNQGPPNVLRMPGVLNMAVRGWWKHYGNGNFSAVELLGVMGMPKQNSKLSLDFSTILGPLFYTWVVQLLLPTFLQQLVYDKEKRLRMMMKMHGLKDGPYWVISYLWYLVLYLLYMVVFIVAGAAVGLELFVRTNLGVTIVFYFLFGNTMIAFAFMLSSLFSSARTVVVVGFVYIIASGLLGFLLFQPFMEKNASWLFFVEWVPAFGLYRGIWEISSYTFLGVYKGTPGLSFSNFGDVGNGMLAVWGIFIVEWFVFMGLGWYFEQVISSGTGVSKHPLFFLERFGYGQKRKAAEEHAIQMSAHGLKGGPEINGLGGGREDVLAERMRIETMRDYSNTPIVVQDLKKVYPGLDGGLPKMAVKTLTMGVERGECFGLLGPNGAGKSTAINMLTGFLTPSDGTGFIEGNNIKQDMDNVYKIMGVCPQHDLLWEQLTGREHLLFYGRLKGLTGKELQEQVELSLKGVNLWNNGVADKLSVKYSGGMRRRLSVAISYMGNPKVVYLDEPSTGLDPASRRNLWEVVKANKAGRATILTTHSMEEAETLCDRLGIFVDGELVCIGAPKEITNRYAGYLVFTISVPESEEALARETVLAMSPNAKVSYSLAGTFKYELPTADVSLSQVFTAMSLAKQRMSVLDWGVANATLEEVFIKFARQIGAKSADQ
ncbi:MAG: hypothetical protein WDW36_002821 [Sanguina aurantia]